MKTSQFTLRFNTPAFLGNAEQSGQWRTPPIKALLRQWWRVAYAADHGGFNGNTAALVEAMRREEGLIFGVASDNDHGCRKSQVRIRLDRWYEGNMRQWQPLPTVSHPEVRFPVGSDLYLGYGPLTLARGARQPSLKANAAIQASESATFSIAFPEEHAQRIERALWLMDRYGTLGGRSRNGWGSLALLPINGTQALGGEVPLRPWRDCLHLDWPHAIGRDDKGALIWQTPPHNDWKALMKTLAIIKIGLRTLFVFPSVSPPHPNPLPRHWLSYPITRHATHAFDRNARLPNQLRFKVRQDNDGKLVGVIFHVPHLPPPAFKPNQSMIECVWRCVHGFLDALVASSHPRWPACACLGQGLEEERQKRLKGWWEKTTGDKAHPLLKRIPE
ncbi:MAG: hypothetical protein K6346_03470 [Halothiobacillaceae bacterium]